MNLKKRKLICIGDPYDINAASGTPYYILKYGIKIGLISKGIIFKFPKNKLPKYLWNMKQFIKTGKYGGYQYTTSFLNKIESKILKKNQKKETQYILSHHPSIPIYPWPKNFIVDFYIDATNKQIFENFGTGATIDNTFKSDILLRERNAYKAAGSIFCMCQWAADSVVRDYKIDPKKVHVIVGGPNLDENILKKENHLLCPKEPNHKDPLIIGFLGKDWERKGGKFTYELVKNLNSLGMNTILRVIGVNRKDIPKSPFIQNVGYIDKNKDFNKFLKEISSWHFSALFSYSEGSPRSNLESLKLGVPILSHNIGGISSTFIKNYYGNLFDPFPTTKEVCDWIISEIKPYDNYQIKRNLLKNISTQINWEKELLKMRSILEK